MPDDSAFFSFYKILRCLQPEILVRPWKFLNAGVKNHSVVDEVGQSFFVAKFLQVFIQFIAFIIVFIFLPGKIIFCLRLNGPVTQTLGIVAGHNELHRGIKPLVEQQFLIGDGLVYTFCHIGGAAFQFQHSHCNAVDVQNNIRTAGVLAFGERHLFRNAEFILLPVLPFNGKDGIKLLAQFRPGLYAIAQQRIHGFVAGVDIARIGGCHVIDFLHRLIRQRFRVASLQKVPLQDFALHIAVMFALFPVAVIVIAQLFFEKCDNAVLGDAFNGINHGDKIN